MEENNGEDDDFISDPMDHHSVKSRDVATVRDSPSVHTAPLTWGEAGDVEATGTEFDLVLASDVVYHDHLYEPLLQTLRSLLIGGEGANEKKTVFLMAHHRRWKKESSFFKKARKVFDVDTIHIDKPPNGSRLGVIVYRFCSKGLNLQ